MGYEPAGQVADMQTQKYCVDCKFRKGSLYGDPHSFTCDSPMAPTNPVTGKRFEIACQLMRATMQSAAGLPTCTINGNWFVAKEPAP